MDDLKSAFQWRLCVLVTLSTLLLGMGERVGWYPALMVAAAAAAYVWTERRRAFWLSNRTANVLAVLGGVLLIGECLMRVPVMLALAHFAIYMQFILLFRNKHLKDYWYLVLLALLEVPVAAVINLRIGFAPWMLVYLFLALVTMMVFYLYREGQAASPLSRRPTRRDKPAPEVLPSESSATSPSAPERQSEPRLWTLADQPSWFQPGVALGPTGTVRRLRWHSAWLGMVSLPLAVGFFLAAPRTPEPEWDVPMGLTTHISGFDQQIRLGSMQGVLESEEPVMKVTFRDQRTDEAIELSRLVLFRGLALVRYEDGQWTQLQTGRLREFHRRIDPDLIVQEMELQPLSAPTLFAVWPITAALDWGEDRSIVYEPIGGALLREPQDQGRLLRYKIFSPRRMLQQPEPLGLPPLLEQWRDEHLQLPEKRLSRLVSLAQRIVRGIPPDQQERRARALESYLRSAEYSYLVTQHKVEPGVDPVERFLFEEQVGHCEHFASALTLMLRAVDIPARVVNGFRGGEWNSVGEFYEVRQKHAHSWVEAYLGSEKEGRWLTLDPTPTGPAPLPAQTLWMRLREYRAYLQSLWTEYVLGYNAQHQRRVLHNPGEEAFGWWGREGGGLAPTGGWSIITVPWVVAGVAFAAVLVVFRLIRLRERRASDSEPRRWRWSWRLREWLGRSARHALATPVDFYRRLTRLLARHRWERPAHQTPSEFARDLATEWQSHPQTASLVPHLQWITDAYYRVRFGGQSLLPDEQQRVHEALNQLAQGLQQLPASS